MTIKQQGGIFGRNPTFNKVTTEGAVTFEGSNNPTLTFKGSSNNQNLTPYGSIEFYNADGSAAGPNIAAGIKVLAKNGNGSGGEIAFFTSDGTQGEGVPASETVRVDGRGNIVIQTSGSGIDFSATSGTGTSELFSDYEEGTWTPALQSYDGTPTTSGAYTKIGDVVVAEASIALDGTSDPSGFVITNPPFAANTNYIGGGFITKNDGGATDVLVSQSGIGLFRLRNSSDAAVSYNAVGVSATLVLTLTYKAA